MIENAWSDADARAAVGEYMGRFPRICNEDLALRVYTARLIGRDPRLVLHGGGNTSVKTALVDDLGEAVEVLCVKGSGRDLSTIEPPDHPAVRLAALRDLRSLEVLHDDGILNAMRIRLLNADAPNPSVEALLHAFLPHKFVDHSHADAVVALLDQADAEAVCREAFGDRFTIVPYVMSGFALAKRAAAAYEANPDSEGLLLLHHGLFTYGATAHESYHRHIHAVRCAEEFIAARRPIRRTGQLAKAEVSYTSIVPVIRGRLGDGGRRYVLTLRQSESIRSFVDDPALASLALRGPVTPDHVIRTKRHPLIMEGLVGLEEKMLASAVEDRLARYRDEYRSYLTRHTEARRGAGTRLDPEPRVILVPGLGLIAVGRTEKEAGVAADIYEHSIDIIRDAEAVGRYQQLPESDLFEMEYWSLEQAKLEPDSRSSLAGHVVYVTGSAGGIGAATARCFARAGAHLYLVDRAAEGLGRVAAELGCASEVVDMTDRRQVEASLDNAVARYGGIDGVVSNAGTAPQAPIDECPADLFRESLEVNLLSHQWVAAATTRVLRRQGTGGFLLFNASKAAFNPGPGFGPYAVAKAALVALMRQYALEGGRSRIRANAVNADRIRTGLLPAAMVEARARARGLEADAYFRSNLLGREVTADDVAGAFLALALAKSTTGAVLTVDGGNIAAAPR